jgi:hypothetical protein
VTDTLWPGLLIWVALYISDYWSLGGCGTCRCFSFLIPVNLRQRGAPDDCHVISENIELDGKRRCVPGVLAYFEGEGPERPLHPRQTGSSNWQFPCVTIGRPVADPSRPSARLGEVRHASTRRIRKKDTACAV